MSLSGLKIVVDCANGAAYSIAPLVLRELGAEVIEIGVHPDGNNINLKCGALFPEEMCRLVKEHQADAGIALDGDADRVIFCDENSRIVNGDQIIGMIALDYRRRRRLSGNSIVVTGMSNLGLHQAMKEAGIAVETTDVGDRYVIERMRSCGYNVGGEQSGHIIFMDYATTGDGLISALHVLKLMKSNNRRLSELAAFMPVYPQIQDSFAVDRKIPLEELVLTQSVIGECETALAGCGRTIVRYSGTENKLRILVEAAQAEAAEYWMQKIKAAALGELTSN